MHDPSTPHLDAWRIRQDWALAQHYLTRALADLKGPLQHVPAHTLAEYRTLAAESRLVARTPATEAIADVRQRYGVDITVQALHALYTDRWTLEHRCRKALTTELANETLDARGARLMAIVEAATAVASAETERDDRHAEDLAWSAEIDAEIQAYGPYVVISVASDLLDEMLRRTWRSVWRRVRWTRR